VGGPDIDELRTLADDDEVDGVLVVPRGSRPITSRLPTTLDIEASQLADSLGLAFARTSVVNDDVVMADLAELIQEQTPERACRPPRSRPDGPTPMADRPTSMTGARRRLVIVGGGISRLAAAWEASIGGTLDVTVSTTAGRRSSSAPGRTSGKLRTSPVGWPRTRRRTCFSPGCPRAWPSPTSSV
jgi:hypothetical protein